MNRNPTASHSQGSSLFPPIGQSIESPSFLLRRGSVHKKTALHKIGFPIVRRNNDESCLHAGSLTTVLDEIRTLHRPQRSINPTQTDKIPIFINRMRDSVQLNPHSFGVFNPIKRFHELQTPFQELLTITDPSQCRAHSMQNI
ncbi:hypothetical protein TcWFU_005786 [Taenia crassiceps]|uniref:Uncharacterized protein n=1 Tax=Taenia crassiceps TaxID=6207 RepID=A0ABR4Q2H5_9CEST